MMTQATPDTGRDHGRYVFGVLLILAGALMLAGQLDISVGSGVRLTLGDWWPLMLVGLGAARFVSARAAGRRLGGGYWLMFVGGLLLLHTYEILRLTDSWPLFIVAGGVSIIVGRARCDAQGA